MGICIDKLPHSCGSKSGLQVFADPETGKVDGYCFSCGKPVANPYGSPKTVDDVDLPEPKTESEIQDEILEVSSFPTVSVKQRKLRDSYLKKFGIKTSLSEEDGKTPTAMYFPVTKDGVLSGYYVKALSESKHQWAIGDVKKAEPFNWQNAKNSGAYRLIIVEGREDAVATEAMFDLHGKEEYKPAIIALPNGVKSVKSSLTQVATEINRKFKEIVIVYDDDEAGKKAVEETMLIFPSALTVTLPGKDPNECLIEGRGKAAYKAMSFQATKPKNTRIVSAKDLHEAGRTPTEPGILSWPFPKLNKLMRRLRTGETVYVGAGVKMGKSERLDASAAHIMEEDDVPILVIKPEQGNIQTYKKLAGKLTARKFDDPDADFDFDAYDKAGDKLADKLHMIDLYQHMDWDTMKADITYAATSLGVKAVFIDPITVLTNGMSAADANTKLSEVAQDMSAMAKDLDIVIFIFCHLKAPEGNLSKEARLKKYAKGQYTQLGNCPHEYGGDVLSAQFAGSRSMMRSCNLMIGLEGNKDPEVPEEVRNMRNLVILEDREFGNSDRINLYWNKNTTLFKEINDGEK